MLAGNEAARANLAPKLIRAGLLLLCLWWVFTLLLAGQTLGYPPPAILLEPRFLSTVLWIAIALLAWGILRGSLTQTAPKALPLVLTVLLCGQAVHAVLPFLVLLLPGGAVPLAVVWPMLLLGVLVIASRVATLVAFRRLPLLAMLFVLLNAFGPLLADNGGAVSAASADVAATAALQSQPTLDTGTQVFPVNTHMVLSGPSLALDLFAIALLYAFYRSRRATPPQEPSTP
jgi:hypothetical protein